MNATIDSPPHRQARARRPRKFDEVTLAWERITKLREAEIANLKAENAKLREWAHQLADFYTILNLRRDALKLGLDI